MVLDLRDFAYDLDDDPLTWSIEGIESSKCSFVIAGNDLMINMKSDKYGICNSQNLNVSDGNSHYTAILNVTIAPQPDLPTIVIGNVNLIDKTAVTVQWDLIDLDEELSADVTFYLENISQNVTSSCNNDETNHISKCVTMLVLPEQHDGNITITIRVTDLELNQTVGIEYTLDMNLKLPAEESENIQSDSISNEMIIAMAGILLIIVLVIFINKNSNSNAHLLRQELPDVEQEVSDDKTDTNEEKDSETGTTGLLARAKKI
jgi:hypothetical protein